jgi:hypothetical protein
MIGIVYMGCPFGIGFHPSTKQILKYNGETAHTVSNHQKIFEKYRGNNYSGVLSPRRPFFLYLLLFLQYAILMKYGGTY